MGVDRETAEPPTKRPKTIEDEENDEQNAGASPWTAEQWETLDTEVRGQQTRLDEVRFVLYIHQFP